MDRKRSFDYTDSAVDNNKKSRYNYDDRKCRTRILVNKTEYSRIIGKGGHSVTNIRNISGAELKGTNVDDELTMLVISGTFRQIIDAFELISEILHNIIYSSFQSALPVMFSLKFLVDDEKVGKIIGMNGVVIQNMKARSGATDIRMQRQMQFGFELHAFKEGKLRYCNSELTAASQRPRDLYSSSDFPHLDPLTHPEMIDTKFTLDFSIDTSAYKIGRVIGKGAMILRNIQREFHVYIRIAKEEENGVRKVTIKGDIERNLSLARDCMMRLLTQVETLQKEVNSPK